MSDPNKNPFLDPNYGSDIQNESAESTNPFLNPELGKEKKKGLGGQLKDFGASVAAGAASLPDIAIGLADIYTEGRVGKDIQDSGVYTPGSGQQYWNDQKTDQAKAQQKQFQDADGILEKTKVALSNPSLITNAIGESLVPMFAGGLAGRGVAAATGASPVIAGAVGEGAIMAGSQAESIRQQSNDGLLDNGQQAGAALTGVAGTLFGYAGGRLAQKLGIGDVDTMLVSGRATPADIANQIANTPAKSLPRRVIEGAISEGLLEELPQSVSEQVIQNLALGKDWSEGVDEAIVMGTLAGAVMGGVAGGIGGNRQNPQQPGQNGTTLPTPFNSQNGQGGSSALNGEYIPAGGSPQAPNQNGRTAYVYDQFDTNADNRLTNDGINPNNGFNPGDATGPTANGPTGPNNPPAPNGNYFDTDQAFDDLLNEVPPANQTPSQRMGLNPNDGPLSTAAALAVDTGASPAAQLGYTEQQQGQEQAPSNTPISDAVPSNYQSLLGSQNDRQPFNANLEDATVQQENTQADNAGKSISQQYDTNAADAMGGAIEADTAQTTSAQTVQPILGQDGKNKWFGTQDKAQAFIDKKNLANDYQVTPVGKSRFEIQPKANTPNAKNEFSISGVDDLIKNQAGSIKVFNQATGKEVPFKNFVVSIDDGTAEVGMVHKQFNTADDKGAGIEAYKLLGQQLAEKGIKLTSSANLQANGKGLWDGLVKQGYAKKNKNGYEFISPAQPQAQDAATQWNALSAEQRKEIANRTDISAIPKRNIHAANWEKIAPALQTKLTEAMSQPVDDVAMPEQPRSNVGDGFSAGVIDPAKMGSANQVDTQSTQASSKPSPTENKIRETLLRNDTQQNGKKMEQVATILANQIKKDGPDYFTLGWQKNEQSIAEARFYIEEILDPALSNLGVKGFDDADSFSRLTDEVLESIDDVYASADDSGFNDRPYKDSNGDYQVPKLVKIKDKNGRDRYVYEHELNDPNVEYLRNFTENGRKGIARLNKAEITREVPKQNNVSPKPENIDTTEKRVDAANIKAADEKITKSAIQIKSISYPTEKTIGRIEYTEDGFSVNVLLKNSRSIDSQLKPEVVAALNDFEKSNKEAENPKAEKETAAPKQAKTSTPTAKAEKPKANADSLSSEGTDFESLTKAQRKALVKKSAKKAANLFKVEGYEVDTSGEDVVVFRKNGYKSLMVNYTIEHDAAEIPLTARGVRTSPIYFSDIERNGLEPNFFHRFAGMLEDHFIDANLLNKPQVEQPKAETEKPKAKSEPSKNTLVSDDRAAELRARLKAKLSQLNSGIDPEIMAIGAELAVYHIERGARKFAALAKNIADDLDVSVDKIRPYLRSWYNGARDMMEDMGGDIQGMDDAETVRAELAKLDNPQQDSGENFTQLLNGLTEEFGKKNVSIDADGKTITVKGKGISTDVTSENGSFSVFSMDEGLQMTGPASVNDLQGVIAEIDKAIGSYGAYLQARSEAKAKAAQEKAAAKEAEKQEVGDSVAYEPSSKSVEQQPIIHTEGKKKEVATTDVVKDSFDKAKAKQTKAEYDAMLNGFVADIEAAIKAAPDKPFKIEVPIISKARPTANGSPTTKEYVASKDLMTLDDLASVIDSIEKAVKGNTASYLQERATAVISDAVNEYQANYGNAPLRIVFDVKGDGRFNVRNDKQTLENFLKKVKNNSGFKPPVESKEGRETFNRVNAIRDTLKDSGDKYRILNAYEMAKSMGYPIVYGDYGDYGIIAGVVLDTFDHADHTFHTTVQLNDLEGNKKENIGKFSVVTEQGISITPANTQKEAKANLTKAVKPDEGKKIDLALRNHRSSRNIAEFRPQPELQQQFESKLYESLGLELPGNQEDTANEQPTSRTPDSQGTSAVRNERGSTQQGNPPADYPNVEAGVSAGSTTSGTTQTAGRSGIRGSATDVANNGGSATVGNESSRRTGASGAATLPVEQPTKLESPAAVANTATDFYMDDPVSIIGGTPVKRYEKNRAALELLEELEADGRQATTDEQKVLAGYTGWGSFGQELFQGTWDRPVFKDDGIWKERNLWLRERMGKQAWESAKNSTINAHFTDPYTVAAMWSMAEKMGFTGGRVLEPAVGTGNFVSLMPLELKQRSQVTGIDMDITTAAIAKQLFPQSNIQNMPYQKSKTPDNFYDLVISNVPFADFKIADRRYNQFNPNVHDYFFLKALDQVRPGGIVMAITSSGTMDKQGEVIRRELAKKAELITTIRLPTGAFQEYAGTAVVTDIIVLRKRHDYVNSLPEDTNWIKSVDVNTPNGKVKVNQYYAENPQNIMGTLNYGSGTTRYAAGMIVDRPADLKQRLENLADLVPEDALLPRHADDHLTYYANKAGERTNTLTMSDGELMFVYGDQMVKASDLVKYEIKSAKDTAARKKSIEDLVAIRKAYTDLTDAERIEQDNVESLRKNLNKLYQAYVKEHGPLEKSFGLQYFKKVQDAYYYSLAALEVGGKPAEILKRSVVRGAANLENPTVSDAFIVERNKSAAPSLANIAKIAGVTEEQARTELVEKGAVYVLPNGDVMPSDMYLAGNVRLKLEEAQNAVSEGNADLQRNVDALKAIIPDDIPYFNIEAKMGATWVPLSDYEAYIAHMLGMTDSNGITVTFPSGKWKVKLDKSVSNRPEASTNYGSQYRSFQSVVSAALGNQTITIKRRDSDGSEYVDMAATEEVNEKISKIKEDFATWLWSDAERRVKLEKEYNYTFNAWATPKYDGSFMSMQGMALSLGKGPFNLRQHQQNAIWRAIVNRRSINAHEVGTGKTFTMGGIALESRRYGIAKKPLILAHNANSAAVAKEIQMMYPSARVLFISELGKAVRHIRMRQIANDDWDVVVMPHSMIDKLTLSEETLMAMAADDIAALEAELEEALAEEGGATLEEVLAMDSETVNKKMGFKNPTAKELAKTRLKLLEDIQKQAMSASKEDAVNFEELGVDMIMVDEVHEFKKPTIATRMKMKGLNTSSNKRSINLQLLTRYVRRMNNGGNVHTFTGTPITNTLTEIYHQMRYVMEEEMQKLNVAAWDGWFGSFATDITDIELSATGEYQLVTRLAGFVNVPELRKMIGQFMDIVFANDMPEMQPRKTKSGKILSDESLTEAEKAELINGRTEDAKDRPYKKVINITTEMSPKQEQALAEIQSLAKEWEQASGKEKRKWMRDGDPRSPLSISTAAKKASYDARIGDPEFVGQEGLTEDFSTSKASQVVKNVMEVYQSHPLASQVIFADTGYNTTTERSTGQKDGNGKMIRERVKVFSPIKDIVERLVQQGIPREQIAIVDGSVKAEARKAIADKVNTGEIRVVIGLTQTLGVGVNMQKNLRAMHHLDAPWMPGELEQRNGRGLRQGNQWNTVLEYRYITDKLDGKSWQVLAIKDRFINAFMKADSSVRSIEGDAAADNEGENGGDIMSSFSEASGDPRVLQRIKTKEKLEKLQRKERLHTQGIADMRRTISNTQRRITRFNELLAEYSDNSILERVQKMLQAQSENFSMEVDGKKYDKRKDAEEAIDKYIVDHVRTGSQPIKFAKYAGVPLSVEWKGLDAQATLFMNIGPIEYRGNTLRGVEGKLRGTSQDIQKLEQEKAKAQDTVTGLSKAVEQPFGQADQLMRTQQQLDDIEADLVENPVAPPIWLRRGAPVDSEIYYRGKLFIVSGHKYTNDGWFVSADDSKGTFQIPYMEATDSVGMPVYEEREFEAPNIEDKTKTEDGKKQPKDKDPQNDEPLYSRKSGNQKTGKTIAQVRDTLIKRFGKDVIESLEKQGKLRIAQSYGVEGVEGFYQNGRAILIADNLNDDSIIPTFLHELGGHAGFQNMMPKQQYDELMRQFNKLVEQGNPIALEAKRLAERESNAATQQLEMLPYLLSIASNSQIKNAIQKGAVNRLIADLVSKVKAWLFDRFAVNLNLTPNDMVALAERMLKKDPNHTPPTGTKSRIAVPSRSKPVDRSNQTKTEAFKTWFSNSKVVDSNGEPLTMYHGTAKSFDQFNTNDFGALLGKGSYFTANVSDAAAYADGKAPMQTYLSIQNPYYVNSAMEQVPSRQQLKDMGHDGVILLNADKTVKWAVAHDPKQIKSATANNGEFDSTNPDIRFSRQTDLNDLVDRISNSIKAMSVKTIKNTPYTLSDWKGVALQALGRRQLVEIYNSLLPQLSRYNRLAEQMDADKNDAGAEADNIVREWSKLKDEKELAELMHDATLAKIDPTKPYVKGSSVSKYKQLRDRYNALSPEAQTMFTTARDAYKKHYSDVHKAIKERVQRSAMTNPKKAALLQEMDATFFNSLKGIYFPLARFGKFVVTVRNNKGEVESVSRAETRAEAEALREEMIKQFPNSEVSKVRRDSEFMASRDAVGRNFMSNLFEEVGNLGLSAADQSDFEDTLNQLYLSSLPDLSWAKHGIHRKGTAGFSQDARRAFAQNMFHGASYLAKLRYADQLAEQLDDMKKHADQMEKTDPAYDQPKAQAVIDEMNKRHENLMNPKSHPLSSFATSLGFVWYLGLSPASAMVNLSQTALVAYPVMGAKWGFDQAGVELYKASKQFAQSVELRKPEWNGLKTDWYKTMSSDISKFLNTDEVNAYKEAVRRGVIDVTQAHDLAGIAQGEDSGVMWKTRPIMRAASTMFHQAERFNREVTFIASYRLARASGANHDAAFEQAVDVTYKGHFDYSSGNRPRIMQGNIAKVILLFKQFGQNMLYTMIRQTYLSFKGKTDAEKREARRAIGGILAMHTVFAGVLGLPMINMGLALVSALGGDDDEPFDAESELRNYLSEAIGDTATDVLMRGFSRALPWDISGRVSINNLIIPDVQEGLEGRRWAESAITSAAGPIAGMGVSFLKGLGDMSEGHIRLGLESMLPTVLKSMVRTVRYADEGAQDKTGISIQDDVGLLALAGQAQGFAPSSVRLATEGKSAVYRLNKRLNERRQSLMTQYVRARMDDDQDAMQEIWDEIETFNGKNPSRRITRANLSRSYRSRMNRIDDAENGVYLPRKQRDDADIGRFAFDEE